MPADLPELVELEKSCFAIPWSEEALRRDLLDNPAACYLAAVAPDGRLAGYAACWQVLDEGQITNLAVAPAWRRLGLGRRLMLELIGRAEQMRICRLFLEVRQGNAPARHLYESLGFEPIGLRRGYYADNGESAITMLKIIGQKND